LQVEQVLVAGHETIRVGGDQCAKNGKIIGIAAGVQRHVQGCYEDHLLAQRVRGGGSFVRRHAELFGRVVSKLVADEVGGENLMLLRSEGGVEQRFAHAARKNPGEQHVGVENDLHETALKMSSSVTNPPA